MTAGPKGVAGRPDSLPAQQIAADPLQSYCPDLDHWPGSWAYEPRDIPPGLWMVECFKPFLRELLALSLSRKTLRLHRDHIGDDGGPLLSNGQSEAEQRAFDATCRKLFRFLTAPAISRRQNARSS